MSRQIVRRLTTALLLTLCVSTPVSAAPTKLLLQSDISYPGAQATILISDPSSISVYDIVLVDQEAMLVTAILSNKLTVTRAYLGTAMANHSSGADVYTGAQTTFQVTDAALGASCSTSDPWVNIRTGKVFLCGSYGTSQAWIQAKSLGASGAYIGPLSGESIGNTAALNANYDLQSSDTINDLVDQRHTFTSAFTQTFVIGTATFLTANPTTNATAEFYGINLEARGATGNTKTFPWIGGADIAGYQLGTGAVQVLNGVTGNATNGNPYSNLGGAIVTSAWGVRGKVTSHSTATMTNAFSLYGLVTNTVAGTIVQGFAGVLQVINLGLGEITASAGLVVRSPINSGGGTMPSVWGVYIEDQTMAGATTNYQLYSAGTLPISVGSAIVRDLQTTGAAAGKKTVCVDTATGKLYASSTGTDCSN